MEKHFLNPDSIIKDLSLGYGMKVADFGCGTGYFVFAAGKAVGVDGEVYAVDVQKSALSALQSQIELLKIKNVKSVWGDCEVLGGSKIKDEFLDAVFIINTLHQSDQHEKMIKESARVLKSGGKLLIIDWQNNISAPGPEKSRRLSIDVIKPIILANGFNWLKDLSAGKYHFALLFEKK